MSKHRLLVVSRNQDEFARKLSLRHLPDLDIVVPRSDAELEFEIPRAEIILADPPVVIGRLDDAASLRWMQSTFAGVDALIERARKRDYVLTNVKDTYGEPIAEFVFAYILMFERDVLGNLRSQHERRWDQRPYGTLSDRTLGIMGTGSIGAHIAKVAAAFGMNALGYRSKAEPVEGFREVFDPESLEPFLRRSDYVVSVLPSTKATRGLIDSRFLSLMRTGSVLMNVGRGDAVVSSDLVAALNAGTIRAAVLDVFEREPLPDEDPLWSTAGAYLTPHVSGYCISDRIFDIFEENYQRYRNGDPLRYTVDFERGY